MVWKPFSTLTSATPFNLTVPALGAYGHIAAGYLDTVTFRRFLLARSYMNLGSLLVEAGRRKEAEEVFREGLAVF